MRELLEKLIEAMSDEQERYFIERTNKHIELVQAAINEIVRKFPEFEKELVTRGWKHDASKFEEPERTPYVSITWRHKLEKEKDGFDSYRGKGYQRPGLLPNKEENDATLHHILNNDHHPEYWLEDKSKANINAQDRDKSDFCVDASRMPPIAIAEMVADWQAMAWELGTNTAREWYNKQKDVRWHFSEEQDKLIDELLRVFEEEREEE
jgi:hypothetical protein